MYDELFNSNNIPYFILPFNVDNYRKYVEMVYKYSNKFSTFTEDFKENLNKIINSIYPVGKTTTFTTTQTSKPRQKGGLFRR